MEHQLCLALSSSDIEGDKKRVNLVNKNNYLDKVRVEGKEGVVKEESEHIKIGLGICADGFQEPSNVNIKEGKVIPVVTINQLKELHQQVLIFNYIAAGICVPFKLVIPIWKSVASSVFGSISGESPSNFSSYFHPQGVNYKSLMDPEPGRCRRTDGKKWRCRKDVVPDTKYCERHMHRGRSRKRVETSGITLQSSTPTTTYTGSNTPTTTYSGSNTPTTTCSKKTSQKIQSLNPADTSAEFPKNHQNKEPSLNESKPLTSTATAITTSSANGKSKTINTFVENGKSSRENTDNLDGTGSHNIKDKKNKGNSRNGDKHGPSVTPELSISLKSVVYGDISGPICKNHGVTAEELQRCRRTDGKRWRCSREAIPQQKYCGSHMNRGSKRCKSSSEAKTVTATPASLATLTSDHTNLNTDLSISPAKFPRRTVKDLDSSTSGSSSNATTVTDTDETTKAFHILSSSP